MKAVVVLVSLVAGAALAQPTVVPNNYCGSITDPSHRNGYPIPDAASSLRLIGAYATVRHGDRVTSRYSYPCWAPDKAEWSCNITVSQTTTDGGGHGGVATPVDRVYRKVYDAGQNMFPGTCMVGELTRTGYQQHLLNGGLFRDFYVTKAGLLPSSVTPNTGPVHLRADDSPRVIQSAQALISAMFPTGSQEGSHMVKNSIESRRSVPKSEIGGCEVGMWDVHTMDEQFDDTTPNPNLCPLYGKYNAAWMASDGYAQHFKSVTLPLMERVKQVTGTSRDASSLSPVSVMDCLQSHLCHGFEIPGFDQDLYNDVIKEATWNWQAKFSFPSIEENARAGIGFLIKRISAFLNARAEPSPPSDLPLFYLHAGHDSTLIPLLNALGVWDQSDNLWVPYASYVNFELYEPRQDPTTEKYVRIVYNGQELVLPGCGSAYCNITAFNSIVTKLVPGDDPAAECGSAEREPLSVEEFHHHPHRFA